MEVCDMTFFNFNEYYQKNKKIFQVIIGIAVVLFGLSVVFFAVQPQLTIRGYEKEATLTDANYSQQFEEIFKPVGAKRINSVLYEIDRIDDRKDKLNAIAEWEIQNFSSSYWGSNFTTIDRLFRYYDYGDGKIRAYNNNIGMSSPYRGNPYWIAYHKAGECLEKAALFEAIADRAGFTTQGVGYPGRHAWVEIKNISSGEWLYFDVDCYHNYLGDPKNSTLWYNETKYYRINCCDFDSPVTVDKTGEDITKRYQVPKKQQELFQKGDLTLPSINKNILK
jgi:hypothetical protein